MALTFEGYRYGLDLGVCVHVLACGLDQVHHLPMLLDEYNGSPTGFECGYSGAGPTQLAYALLRRLGFSAPGAKAKMYTLRDRVIRHLPRNTGWTLNESTILAAIEG